MRKEGYGTCLVCLCVCVCVCVCVKSLEFLLLQRLFVGYESAATGNKPDISES